MKNQRWPYHPPPYPNEALSSWLYRVASYFDTEVVDLIRYEFGVVLTETELLNLDFYATDHLLKGLSQCTGFDIYLITSLTTQIYSPMLIDHFNRSDNTLYNHYVEQFRLFEKKKRSIKSGLINWIPWLSTNETLIYYGCRICLQHDTAPFIRLYWRLEWLTSCPYHKVLLQPVRFYNKSSKRIGFYFYDYDDKENLKIIGPLLKLDSYTLEAVTEGQVNLPYKRINGGIWLRILRAVIEELKLPLNSFILKHQKYIKDIWQQLDIYIRNGVSNKSSFEDQKKKGKINLMKATSLVIDSILSGNLNIDSPIGNILSPIKTSPDDLISVYQGKSIEKCDIVNKQKKETLNLREALNKLIESMKIDPNEVKMFRATMKSIDDREERLQEIDKCLRNLGVKF